MKKRTPAVTSKIMASIHSKNTKPEKLLAQAMWSIGLRYRKQYKIVGKPDFVFIKAKVAIFCDGDFWHGNNWKLRGLSNLEEELSSYSDFWKAKILKNIERDVFVNEQLKSMGWNVLRFWESDIKKDISSIVRTISNALHKKIND